MSPTTQYRQVGTDRSPLDGSGDRIYQVVPPGSKVYVVRVRRDGTLASHSEMQLPAIELPTFTEEPEAE